MLAESCAMTGAGAHQGLEHGCYMPRIDCCLDWSRHEAASLWVVLVEAEHLCGWMEAVLANPSALVSRLVLCPPVATLLALTTCFVRGPSPDFATTAGSRTSWLVSWLVHLQS